MLNLEDVKLIQDPAFIATLPKGVKEILNRGCETFSDFMKVKPHLEAFKANSTPPAATPKKPKLKKVP